MVFKQLSMYFVYRSRWNFLRPKRKKKLKTISLQENHSKQVQRQGQEKEFREEMSTQVDKHSMDFPHALLSQGFSFQQPKPDKYY